MEVKAPAKINLALEVLGKRCDGYHEIRTVFQAVDLFDTIRFEASESLELQCSDPELSGESNLVLKAATTLSWVTGKPTPASIHLEKSIPYSMGLGGGSSNAAATLMALNGMHDLECTEDELRDIAASIGSDVAFFLMGGTALGMGRGEVLTPIPTPSDVGVGATGRSPLQSYVVLCPDLPQELGTKTGRLYSLLTPDNYSDGSRTDRLAERLSLGEPLRDGLYNVFEQVAGRAFPGLEPIWEDFSRIAGTRVHLSGSGPALFCVAQDASHGERTLKSLQTAGYRSYLVTALPSIAPSPTGRGLG